MDRRACREGVDLFEDIGELQVELILGDLADMRGRQTIGMGQQRMDSVPQRFGLEGSAAGPGLRVAADRGQDKVVIRVMDVGIGLDDAQLVAARAVSPNRPDVAQRSWRFDRRCGGRRAWRDTKK